MNAVRRFLQDEDGQSMTEYAILVGTLAVGAVLTLMGMWNHVWDVYNYVAGHVNDVPTT